MKKLTLLFCTIFCLAITACNENRIHNEHQDVRGTLTWLKDEKHVYKVNVEDISVPYNVIVAIRHHTKASENNININLTTTNPEGKKESNSYVIPLLDPQNGLPLGEAAGDISDKETTIKSNHKFEIVGEYTFEITPQEKDKDIGGIMEVGLILDKVVSD